MIASRTVYDTCLALAKKDVRGRAFNIAEYNNVSALINMEMFNYYVSKYETDEKVTTALHQFKIRDYEVKLTAGVGLLPGRFAKMAGCPTVNFPTGPITLVKPVDIPYTPNRKLKVTAPNHGLKDGTIVTCSGLQVHTIASEPIHYIDRDNFWVNVNYISVESLIYAMWTLNQGETYRVPIDLVTEEELSVRLRDPLLKPTFANPVFVYQWPRAYQESFGIIREAINLDDPGYAGMALITATNESTPFAAKPGDYIIINPGPGGYNQKGFTVKGLSEDSAYLYIDYWDGQGGAGDYMFINLGEPTQVHVYPEGISSIYVNYLRHPNIPFLDWYMNNATYAITYLDERQVVENFAAGNTYRDGTAGDGAIDITSRTTDWEWPEDMLPEIVYRMLQKMGINLENMGITEIATQLQLKEESNI